MLRIFKCISMLTSFVVVFLIGSAPLLAMGEKPLYSFPVAKIEINRCKIGQSACFASAAFNPAAGSLLTGSGTGDVKVINLFDSSVIYNISKENSLGAAFVNYSPNGKHGIAVYYKGSIALWHYETGEILEFPSENEDLCGAFFSADSKNILIINRTGKIEVRDTKSFELQRIFQGGNSCARARLSPDGNDVMAVFGDGSLNIWGINTGESKLTLPMGTTDGQSQYFSRNNLIVTHSTYYGMRVRILDVMNGSLKHEFLISHKSQLQSLHAIGDSNNMVAVFNNGDVKIFDDKGTETASFEGKIKPASSALTHDGMLCVLDLDSNISIWDTQSLQLYQQFSAQCGYCGERKISFDHQKIVFPGNDSATVLLFAPNEIEKPKRLEDIVYSKILGDYLNHAESKAVNSTQAEYNYHDFISFIAQTNNALFDDAKAIEKFINRPKNVHLYLHALLKRPKQYLKT